MVKILKIFKDHWLIITILILAFLIRLLGITYGLPNFFIGDEKAMVGGALRMIELKTLIPSLHSQEFRLLYYPPLVSYFYFLLFFPVVLVKYFLANNLDLLKINFILNPGIFILLARTLSVLVATANIYLIYLIGKKIFTTRIALFASLFLTFSFLHLQLSHTARHWIYDLFFYSLVLLISLSLSSRKNYILAGIFAGLGFGTSYLSAISIFFPLVAHFIPQSGKLTKNELLKKITDRNLWLMMIVFLIIIIIFIALHFAAFFRISVGEKSGIILEKSLTTYLLSFYYYLKILFKLETFLLFFSLIGFSFLFLKNKKIFYIFSSFIVFYITVLYFLFHHEPRYIFLSLPLLCLAAGFALDYLFDLKIIIRQKEFVIRNYILFFIIPVFAYSFAIALKYDSLLLRKDSRVLAEEWVEKNINSNTKIANYLDSNKLIPVKDAILEQQKLDPGGLRSLEKTLLTLNNKDYPSLSFYVLSLHFIDPKNLPDLAKYLKDNNYQYFLVDYWTKKELGEREKEVMNGANLVKRFGSDKPIDANGNFSDFIFKIFSLNRLGPIVEIYKL